MRRLALAVALVALSASASVARATGVSSAPMQTQHAKGTFDVKVEPMPFENAPSGASLSRMSLDKTFHGDLAATAIGQMLAVGTEVKGSAVYVAVETVSGTLHGRTGTFALRHVGTMERGEPTLSVAVVPDSGTGELAGLAGTMSIRIDGTQHFYELSYTLAK